MAKAGGQADGRGAFTPLVRIDMLHAFFNGSGGRSEALRLRPTPCTAARIARASLLVRPRTGGLDLLYTGAQAETLTAFLAWLRQAVPGGLEPALQDALFGPPLLFVISLEDPSFFNFTEVPPSYRCGAPALSLSNLRSAAGEGQEASLEIDWSAAPDPQPPIGDTSPRDRLEALTGQAVEGWWFESIADIRAAAEERQALAAQIPAPVGFLEIHLAAPAAARPSSGSTVFPILFDPSEASAGASGSGGYIRPCAYTALFPARRTHWRYYVWGGGLDPASLSVVDPSRPEQPCFEGAGIRTLADGAVAACFASAEPIVLSQRPDAAFALRGARAGAPPRTLVRRLPAASAAAILPEPGPPERIWSDIYVHL